MDTCHCTVGVGVPVAAAVKVAVPPTRAVWSVGWVLICGWVGALTVTAAVSVAPLSVCVARTVTVPVGAAAGAVYRPDEVTVPLAAPPSTLHTTGPVAFWRVAVNCWVPPTGSVAVAGVTVTAGGGGSLSPVPPMSVSMFIVNVTRRGSGEAELLLQRHPSSPHAHWRVPAANTLAPDGAVYLLSLIHI